MSRILNVAGVAALGLATATTLFLAEPGFASDLGADTAPTLTYPGDDLLDELINENSREDAEVPTQLNSEADSVEGEEQALPTAKSLAALVSQTSIPQNISSELRCLAGTVYFEARGESLPGQLAVANVVLNRTKSGRFPSSICGVVMQRAQFSFVRGGKMPRIREGKQWNNALAIARIAQDSSWEDHADGALFFHARHVSPNWGKKRMATIDNHIFYR